PDTAAAILAATTGSGSGGGGVATLLLPADMCWSEGATAVSVPARQDSGFDLGAVESAAKILREGAGCLLFVGGANMTRSGLRAASRIARATGARLMAEKSPARHERGAGVPTVER